jgi:DNA-binding CsgD family transcriptional regulator
MDWRQSNKRRIDMRMTIRLTSREAEVLQLLARGRTYLQISDRLGMSVHTVQSHVKNVYRKLDVHSARAAVWRAMELRLFGEQDGLQLASQEVS